jgi:hypothetical protein
VRQTVSHNRNRRNRQKSAETAEIINKSTGMNHSPARIAMMIYPEMSLKPPPIYINCVTAYKAMVETPAKAVDEETYFTKALSYSTN